MGQEARLSRKGKLKTEIPVDLRFPQKLLTRVMHLDPDFDWLTYGDNGDERGSGIKALEENDLLVFYAWLRSVRNSRSLIYGRLYVIDEVVMARTVLPKRHNENAHTRKLQIGAPDIVVRAKPGVSGRLSRWPVAVKVLLQSQHPKSKAS